MPIDKKILISNVYSYQNKGDAAIVIVLIRELRRAFRDYSIIVQTADLKHDKGKYGVPITESLLWILLSSRRKANIIKRIHIAAIGIVILLIYAAVYKNTGFKFNFLINKKLKEFIKHNNQANFIVACGGGYLRTSSSSLKNTILLFVTCLNFIIPKWLGKAVYLYSQSIGPVHGKLQKFILKFALNRVDLIQTRENISFKILKTMNVKTKLILTADPVFIINPHKNNRTPIRRQRLTIGLTVRKWFEDKVSTKNYLNQFAYTLDYLIAEYDAYIVHIPQVIASTFDDDDRKLARQLRRLMYKPERLKLIEEDMDPIKLINYCSRFELLIGTRMHSNIFALINGVPVIAIGYEHKTAGIMKSIGLSSLVIDINKVNHNLLLRKIDDAILNREEYHEKIVKNVELQRKKALDAIMQIKRHYDEKII